LIYKRYHHEKQLQKIPTAGELTRFPDSGIQTYKTTLRTTGILKFAGEPLALAPAAGRSNEEPVGEGQRGE
jgi:hypothetical protein